MREAMFRAVSKETQKYVYGVPIVNSFGSATFIITAVTDSLSFPIERISDFCIEVIPVTLSQYTGLKDSEGTEIYEGDVVRVTHDEYFIYEVCTVVWGLDNDDVYPAFHMPELDTESNSFSEVFNVDGYFVKVIGNIYQNKDLLEGE